MLTNEKSWLRNNHVVYTIYQSVRYLIVLLLITFFSFVIGNKNYLLFHITVELFISIIALFIFLFSLNTYPITKNNSLMFMGVGFAFIGVFDLIHTLTYNNMNIFEIYSMNESIQIWIAARYMEVSALLISYFIWIKNVKNYYYKLFLKIYFVTAILILLSIFYWVIFPVCYVQEYGFTKFKILSQYGIFLIFLSITCLIYKNRKRIKYELYTMIIASLFSATIAEIFFTVYTNPFGNASIMGHLFKAISFYFAYKSVIKTNLQEPYKFLSKKLKETNDNMKDIIVKNQECFNLLITKSKDSIIVHSKGKLVFANENAVRMFGYNRVEELIGQHINNYILEEEQVRINNIFSYIYANKITVPFYESKVFTSKGSIIDIETSATFLIYNGKPAILAVLRDITPEKQVEMLIRDVETNKKLLDKTQEFNKLITEFFLNISHELKTPINVILGAVQVAELYNKNGILIENIHKIMGYSKSIKQNCFRLLRLVNNLIDISKIDSGYIKLELQNLNIVSVVEEITLSIADYVKNKELNLTFDTDIEERIVAMDPDKIERIMLNLLSNAIKFTTPGDDIIVSIANKEQSVIISVKDTGVGIPEDKLQSIFERFVQVDKTIRRNREGSGIGLSLVKSIVEMHKGTIGIVSSIGEGSEFIIELPAKIIEKSLEKKDEELYMNHTSIERISIEFSDIYD